MVAMDTMKQTKKEIFTMALQTYTNYDSLLC